MTTEERLERLEKELACAKRRNRWLLAGAALALGVGLAASALGPGAVLAQPAGAALKEIRANRFVLEDANGKGGAALALTKEGSGLALLDANGKTRASLTVGKQMETLKLVDENGKTHFILGGMDGLGMLMLFAGNDKGAASLTVGKDGARLQLSDGTGKDRVALSSFKEDGPGLNLYDEKRVGRCRIGATATTRPDGTSTIYPESSIWLFGPDGQGLWKAP